MTKKTIDKAQADVRDLIDRDRMRDSLFVKIDQSIHHVWDLPDGLPDKANMRKFTSSDASDAVKAAKQSLSDLRPIFKLTPLTNHPLDRKRLNGWEKALRWVFWQADKRQSGNITNTVISNAVQYGMVAGKVIYLPHELEARKAFGQGDREQARLRRAMGFGNFALELYNPLEVHAHYSEWMPESIVTKRVMPVESIIEFWGDLAGDVKKQKQGEFKDYNYATLYDYHSDGKRWVWAEMSQSATLAPPNSGASAVIMAGEDTKLDFLPFFVRHMGSLTPGVADTGIDPMLRSMVESGQWEDQNLTLTMFYNRIIRNFYRGQIIQIGGIPLQVNYDNPAQPVIFTPAAQSIQANPEQPLDPGMQTVIEMNKQAIHKSTVPEIFQTGDVPSGIGVGTIQQISQNTTQGFTPVVKLAESVFGDIGALILHWVEAHGEPYTVYGVRDEEPITIDPAYIEPTLIDGYVHARLVPDLTADVAMANAAMLARQAGLDEESAFEIMGVENYEEIVEKRRREQYDEIAHQMKLKMIAAETDLKIKAMDMQLQMQAQQAAPPQEQGMDVNQQREQQAAMMQQQSQGSNPNFGAESPVNSGAPTREEAQAAGLA